MHTFTRILTKMIPTWRVQTPQGLMHAGTAVYTNEDKVRIFFVQDVLYDDSLTPEYRTGYTRSPEYFTVEKLREKHPMYDDTIILDIDKSLKIYEPDKA